MWKFSKCYEYCLKVQAFSKKYANNLSHSMNIFKGCYEQIIKYVNFFEWYKLLKNIITNFLNIMNILLKMHDFYEAMWKIYKYSLNIFSNLFSLKIFSITSLKIATTKKCDEIPKKTVHMYAWLWQMNQRGKRVS